MRQLGLFADDPGPTRPEDRALAARLPPHVKLGTSSWTFPGWSGIVYPPRTSEKTLRDRGLALYTAFPLFGTVGIDRSYYAPIPADELARYATQLPPAFPCVMKAWSALTTRQDHRTGERLPTYLDPETFEREMLVPIRKSFLPHTAAIVLEFPRDASGLSADGFAEELHRFLRRVPRDVPLSVELRTRSHFGKAYLDVLAEQRVSHVLNFWEDMPEIRDQVRRGGVVAQASPLVARLLLRPGTRYADRKAAFEPFDALKDPNPAMRDDVVELARIAASLDKVLLVVVNNKAEGSSPLTVRALAEQLAVPT